MAEKRLGGFCPGVRIHKKITIVLSLFRSHWLAVVYCLVFCIGSCEPVHEDRTLDAFKAQDTRFVADVLAEKQRLCSVFKGIQESSILSLACKSVFYQTIFTYTASGA